MKRMFFSALCLLVALSMALPVFSAQASPTRPPQDETPVAGPQSLNDVGLERPAPVPMVIDPNPPVPWTPPVNQSAEIRPMTASIVIDYIESGTNSLGDICEAFPADAKTVFQAATNVWQTLITSPVTIRIEACWAPLGTGGILGHAGALNYWRNFANAPAPNTWYQAALANALSGSDLDSYDDIGIGYNSQFTDWYFGTDGNPPYDKIDLMAVVMHEIAHGLGFAGSMYSASGSTLADWGGSNHSAYPFSYDRFTYGPSGVSLLNTTTYPRNSAALLSGLTSGNVTFRGENALAANGGANVSLYAPSPWRQGSSYSHLDEVFNGTTNALMTYSIGYGELVAHDPGLVGAGVLKDVGWAPFSPTGLTATAVSATQINLSWTDTNQNESGYVIERSPNGSTGWTAIYTTAANVTSYSDTGLSARTPYYYRVRAYHALGQSLNVTANATTLGLYAPSNLSAVAASPTQINLTWTDTNSSPNETGYWIERSTNGSTWSSLYTTAANATAYNNTGLAEGTRYYYRVTALGTVNSAPAGPVNAYTTLNPPTSVAAAAVSASQVNLTWTDNSAAESGYRVERSSAGGVAPWTDLTPTLLAANAGSFSDTTAPAENTMYTYRVTAVNAAAGIQSQPVTSNSVTTWLKTPTNLVAAPVIGTAKIQIRWTDNSAYETGYEIQTGPTSSGPWTAGSPALPTNLNAASLQWTPSAGYGTYYFRVRAVGSSLNSAWTAPAGVVLSNRYIFVPAIKR